MSPGSTPIISLSSAGVGLNPSSAPQIGKITLSTPSFVWLHASAWEASSSKGKSGDFGFFYNSRVNADPLLCAAPPFCVRGKNRSAPQLAGRWILYSVGTEAKGIGTSLGSDAGQERSQIGWAEAHLFDGDFLSVHIVFGMSQSPSSARNSFLNEALAMLASACMVSTGGAVVCLLPATDEAEDFLATTADFNPIPVWVPRLLAHKDGAGRKVKIGKLESSIWWETTLGAASAKSVAYLKRRFHLKLQEEAKKKAPPRRRFSLLRIFGFGPKKRL